MRKFWEYHTPVWAPADEGAGGAGDGDEGGAGGEGGTPLDGAGGADAGDGSGEFQWADDWRDHITDDPKERKRLDRMKTPGDIFTSFRELEKKLSSGQIKSVIDENSTAEEIAAYREEHGIPASPEGYLENLPDGLVLGDEDKALAQSFLESMHGKNASPAEVGAALDWYQGLKETQVAERAEKDNLAKTQTEDALREMWGGDYRANINAIANSLSKFSVGDGTAFEAIQSARLGDGTPLASHPDMLKMLHSMAQADNPAAFLSPGTAGMQLDSVEDEIAAIEKTMRTNRAAYDKDEKMQARYRDLLDAQDKLASKV
jgi:hypothetical protein